MPGNHSPFRDYKIFLDIVKNYVKADTKVSWSCTILHDSFILFQIFRPWLSVKANIYLKIVLDFFKLKSFDIFDKYFFKYRGSKFRKSYKFITFM